MPITEPRVADDLCFLSVQGDWVSRATEKILWLPPEYRGDPLAIKGNMIAIGSKQGRVVIIKISPTV